MQGYEALRNGAGWFELRGRGKIRVTGEDRVRLLHAMSTNNIEQLGAGDGLYAFFLNAQGRVLADAHIFALPDFLLLDTEPQTAQSLYEHIDKFIIADDVTLENLTETMTTTAIEGPRAAEVLRRLGAPVPDEAFGIAEWNGGYVVRASRAAREGFWIFSPNRIEVSGADEADYEAVETVRLENARPVYGIDFSELNIAHETGQLHALHFSKGCYLGQEIVERVRSRGHVNRSLVPLQIEAQQPPPRGTKIHVEGKDAGEITSAAFSPALGKVVALGIVRAEAQHKPLEVNGTAASAATVQSPV